MQLFIVDFTAIWLTSDFICWHFLDHFVTPLCNTLSRNSVTTFFPQSFPALISSSETKRKSTFLASNAELLKYIAKSQVARVERIQAREQKLFVTSRQTYSIFPGMWIKPRCLFPQNKQSIRFCLPGGPRAEPFILGFYKPLTTLVDLLSLTENNSNQTHL